MNKLLASILLLAVMLAGAVSSHARPIVLDLPAPLIVDAVQQALPITVSEPSPALGGAIAIERIDSIRFADQAVSARLAVSGRDVQLNTEFAGNQIQVKVGNVDLEYDIAGTFRFDRPSRTLFFRPQVADGGTDGSNGEIGALVAALFHDRDLPIPLDRLQPFVAEIGGRETVITMAVDDVIVNAGGVLVHLLPTIEVDR